MALAGKHILLLSPQRWGVSRISKHHYAVEMARRGNRVTFASVLASSSELPIGGFKRELLADHPGLEILEYRPPFPSILKFKAPRLFDLLMRWQARRILKALDVRQVDIVWDFVSSALFADVRVFPARAYVFHPVDRVTARHAKGADVIISLADSILGALERGRIPTHFINHGLGDAFAEQARRALAEMSDVDAPRTSGALQVGYAGNVVLPYIDHAMFRAVIEASPDITFHFWGPNSYAANNLGGGSVAAGEFAQFLRGRANVRLHGAVPQERLAAELAKMDALLLCYDARTDPNGAVNSHKILEYLSTGRAVVATHISSYAEHPGLLEMLPSQDNSQFPAFFRDVIARLPELNAAPNRRRRIEFALEHTYARQLDGIESVLKELKLIE